MLNFFKASIFVLLLAFIACEPVVETIQSDDFGGPVETYLVTLNDYDISKTPAIFSKTQYINVLISDNNIDVSKITAKYSIINGFAVGLNTLEFNKLKIDKRVKFIEKDQVITIPEQVEYNGKQVGILVQTTPWGITAVGGSVDADSNTGVAWIVDTGINLNHPDLNVNTTLSRTFVTTSPDNRDANDNHGHGSHVSGIIGAKNNSIGTIGVCANATVIAVKVMNYRGSGTISGIVNGLNYIAQNLVSGRINVVNMSIGGSTSTTLDNAVRSLANTGAYVVVAAGNSAADATYYSPARVNATRVYTISAFGSNGAFASFSNYGTPVDYSAPGVSIYSTYRGGGYATMSGTSMACPHVVGILLANNGTINYNGYVTNDRDNVADPKAVR